MRDSAIAKCCADAGCVFMQEKRVIEYVALGDFATAVGFLLASTPEKSARYYRDALCTLALAVLLLCCLTLSLCRSISVHAVFCQAIGLYPCLLLHTQLLSNSELSFF